MEHDNAARSMMQSKYGVYVLKDHRKVAIIYLLKLATGAYFYTQSSHEKQNIRLKINQAP